MARIDCISNWGSDRKRYVIIETAPARIGAHDLYEGGRFFHFDIDWGKQRTEMYEFRYMHGIPSGFDKCLKVFKDEPLEPEECLKFAEEYLKKEVKQW